MSKYTWSQVYDFTVKLKADMAAEDNGYNMTDDFSQAIYLLYNGEMISGDFYYGTRSTDHRMIECTMEIDRYDKNFWDEVHERFYIVRLVPESQTALIKVGQKLTDAQAFILTSYMYRVEEY